MLRALALCLLIGCTTAGALPDDPATDAASANEAKAPKHKSAAVNHSPEYFACRKACWDDIPFNACKKQRDACIGRAQSEIGAEHCREMSRHCRAIRKDCLQSCGTDGQALP